MIYNLVHIYAVYFILTVPAESFFLLEINPFFVDIEI